MRHVYCVELLEQKIYSNLSATCHQNFTLVRETPCSFPRRLSAKWNVSRNTHLKGSCNGAGWYHSRYRAARYSDISLSSKSRKLFHNERCMFNEKRFIDLKLQSSCICHLIFRFKFSPSQITECFTLHNFSLRLFSLRISWLASQFREAN